MKIATMVHGFIPAPRPAGIAYAPIDLAVDISEKLVERGHEVDFYGPNGTHLCANVKTLNIRPLVHNQKEFQSFIVDINLLSHNIPVLWDQFLVREMFEQARQGTYDLLHFHHPDIALPYLQFYPDVPVISTLHDPLFVLYRELLEMYQAPNQFYVSISDNQRIPAPDLQYAATVYNGIDTELFSFSEEHDDYLLFAGRIVPEKGVKEAIQVAQQLNERLLIIGPTYQDQLEYFEQHIKPHLNEKILYLGFVEREQLVRYYQKAKALLMPIQWEEPFGLTMIEALACGTPVVAFRRGSVPEVLVDGETGYIVDTTAEMAEAIKKIDKIKPKKCRAHVEQNFSIKTMVDGYEAAFTKLLTTFKDQQACEKGAKKKAV